MMLAVFGEMLRVHDGQEDSAVQERVVPQPLVQVPLQEQAVAQSLGPAQVQLPHIRQLEVLTPTQPL